MDREAGKAIPPAERAVHRRVALTEFGDSRSTWFRQIMEGVEEYVALHRHWQVRLVHAEEREPGQLREWGIDGAIIYAPAMRELDRWRRLNVPLVNVASRHRHADIPTVASDNVAIGELAARHLIELGFTRLGVVHLAGQSAAELRTEGFRRAAVAASRRPLSLELTVDPKVNANQLRALRENEDCIERWLQSLPRPIGIFGWNDVHATLAVQACRRLGIAVPDEVAIIGCDDDEVWCGLCMPTLTSIRPPSRRIGFHAAELLDRTLSTGRRQTGQFLLPPLGVTLRGSTDVVACEDPHVVSALGFIRENSNGRIRVTDVVRHAGISRRNLERRFQEALGRSPLEEIHRIRITRAKELLERTDLPLDAIAEQSGFTDATHLIRQLASDVGITPTQFRNQFRIR